MRIYLVVSTRCANVTDTERTDTARQHRPRFSLARLQSPDKQTEIHANWTVNTCTNTGVYNTATVIVNLFEH